LPRGIRRRQSPQGKALAPTLNRRALARRRTPYKLIAALAAAIAACPMHLVQILLPLYDNDGQSFGEELFTTIRSELTERFGGLTAFTSAPAEGLWKSEGKTHHDEIVVFEVMAATLDARWWQSYRKNLEQRFSQNSILIRAQPAMLL
jgi:hypothetical protein